MVHPANTIPLVGEIGVDVQPSTLTKLALQEVTKALCNVELYKYLASSRSPLNGSVIRTPATVLHPGLEPTTRTLSLPTPAGGAILTL